MVISSPCIVSVAPPGARIAAHPVIEYSPWCEPLSPLLLLRYCTPWMACSQSILQNRMLLNSQNRHRLALLIGYLDVYSECKKGTFSVRNRALLQDGKVTLITRAALPTSPALYISARRNLKTNTGAAQKVRQPKLHHFVRG